MIRKKLHTYLNPNPKPYLVLKNINKLKIQNLILQGGNFVLNILQFIYFS